MSAQTGSTTSPPPPLVSAQAPNRSQRHRFPTLRTILALMLREMTSRYGRSPGGYLWALLEPLGAIIMLSLAFSQVLHTPPRGSSFMLFYATGYLPFMIYSGIASMVSRSITYSRPLLMYPAVTWVDAMAARFVLNALTSLTISFLVLWAILAISDANAVLNLPRILMGHVMVMVFALGVGVLNAALFGLIPIWEMLWGILTRPLFLASGVMFIYEDLPLFLRNILWFNPILHASGEVRSGFYPMYDASYVSAAYVLLLGLGSLFLGCVLMGRYHRTILNNE